MAPDTEQRLLTFHYVHTFAMQFAYNVFYSSLLLRVHMRDEPQWQSVIISQNGFPLLCSDDVGKQFVRRGQNTMQVSHMGLLKGLLLFFCAFSR